MAKPAKGLLGGAVGEGVLNTTTVTAVGTAVAYDPVNHPSQYTQGEVECIDAIDSAVTALPPDEAVCVANVIKYVWRYRLKSPVESLKKARWYLDRLIGKMETRYADGVDV